MQIGVPNRKTDKNIKFTWPLFKVQERMNENFNSCKAITLFKK